MSIKRSLALGVVITLAGASAAGAQGGSISASCPGGGVGSAAQVTQDVCQKTLDFFAFMAPQLGVSMTGGNTTLGQGGALGGLGHFAISVRGNVLPAGGLPRMDQTGISYTGANASDIDTDNQIIGLPAADVALGVFRGLPLGVTNVGGIDLLVSAFFIPEFESNTVSLKAADGSLSFGYGARIGILQESLAWPGVSLSILKRDLPTMTLTATSAGAGGTDRFEVRDFSVKTTAWRLAVAKNLLVFGLSAGIGQDRYTSTASLAGTAAAPPPFGNQNFGPFDFEQKLTRSNMFGGVSLNLLVLRLVAEAGRVSGGDVPTFNSFGDQQADQARTYFSAGVRIGF